MEIGLILKVLFFILWPFLVLYIYYLTNKKKFMAQWEKLKGSGWFK
jgi:Mn2+/Fe2+ NRAMP family transporter